MMLYIQHANGLTSELLGYQHQPIWTTIDYPEKLTQFYSDQACRLFKNIISCYDKSWTSAIEGGKGATSYWKYGNTKCPACYWFSRYSMINNFEWFVCVMSWLSWVYPAIYLFGLWPSRYYSNIFFLIITKTENLTESFFKNDKKGIPNWTNNA